ncbi:MAG: serine hydrolase domain-containing protein [Chitinophagaceae bacterium]
MKPLFYFLLLLTYTVQVQAQDKTRSIDSLLRTYYNEDEPGAFVQVLSNNNILFKKGYGLANLQTKEKITANTNFNIGSVTKQFTAFCIASLAEKKRLSLNDKIGKYLPGMNPAIGNLITIQQLLTHSSGILDHYSFTDTRSLKHATDIDVLNA